MQPIATNREDWLAARVALLEREKAHTRERDKLAEARRALPALRMEKSYEFEGARGPETLVDLFGKHSQLIVYHFMFGTDWKEGCTSCSFWGDNLNGIDIHLAARDVSFVMVSSAPYPVLKGYQERMGWQFKWVSCAGNSFNQDMNVSFTPEQLEARTHNYNFRERGFNGPEAPGLTAFRRAGDDIFHTYGTFGRGLDAFNGAYQLLDLAPKGRNEDDLPWGMAWLRRRDQYET